MEIYKISEIACKKPYRIIYESVTEASGGFIGICENFTPSEQCVFTNEVEGLLIVRTKNILLMERVTQEFYDNYCNKLQKDNYK